MPVLSKRTGMSNYLFLTNDKIIEEINKNIFMLGDRIMKLISTDGKDKRNIIYSQQ